jgi:hypothetical protein
MDGTSACARASHLVRVRESRPEEGLPAPLGESGTQMARAWTVVSNSFVPGAAGLGRVGLDEAN